ncbi:MAG: hypothetical protein HY695_25260 [Deltaproteobacteria bacterium]|nr:hypothetical protein [Deltaproteobacteria bacterium]
MFPQSRLLVSWEDPAGAIPAELGGKAWNLFRLRELGLSVPPWFVLRTAVFDTFLRSQRATIGKILGNVKLEDPAAIESLSLRLRNLILAQPCDALLRDLVCPIWQKCAERALFSVRSSVLGEDSDTDSFAGQMDTFLNVPAAHVVEAVKNVWASAFSSRTLVYRKRKGISLARISTAVIIQEMVQSAQSGVLFTREPESGARRCVVSAGFGLGEGVVADEIETDTYRIFWNSNEIVKAVPVKERRVVRNTVSLRGGNRTEAVPAEIKCQQVLTDSQILELRDMGIKLEESFGTPQDIEWAFDDSGKLFFLQARPIVFPERQVADPTVRIWDNSNVIESYPDLTLPLTFSFVRKGYETSFRPFARSLALGFFPFNNPIRDRLHIFNNMIGLLQGRVYYNLLCWYEMLSFLPGFERRKASWDQMIGITRKITVPEVRLSRFNRWGARVVALCKLLTVRRTARKFSSHFDSVYNRLSQLDLSNASEHQLIDIYESATTKLGPKWYLTLDNDFCAMTYYDWLKRLCNLWGLAQANIENDLLCGEQGVESVAPVHSVVRLAESIRRYPIYHELFRGEKDEIIWQQIKQEPLYGKLREAMESHLKAFGDRGLEELKLDRPSLRDKPELLIGLIKNHVALGTSVEAMERREQKIRRKAETLVRQQLKNPLKRTVFRFVLRNARRAIANRENMRFARSRLFGFTRTLFHRMGDLFAQKGLLASGADIHYLAIDEIFGFVQGTAISQNLKALVEMRRAEYAAFAQANLPERFETTGIPCLNRFEGGERSAEPCNTARGIGCSSGVAYGTARVVLDPHSNVKNGDHILVARSTDPGWVFLMISSKGIVVERGSVLSHTAIIGRELGIPTIVGVKDATTLIPEGAALAINGSTGEVQWKSSSSPLTDL